jgi:hypothetical protein
MIFSNWTEVEYESFTINENDGCLNRYLRTIHGNDFTCFMYDGIQTFVYSNGYVTHLSKIFLRKIT